MAVFVVGVLLPVALWRRVPLQRFIAAVAEPVSIAFATTSSEAALPRAMQAMERIGVPRQIVAFVMPTGYSFNLDGSTLYLSLTRSSSHRRQASTVGRTAVRDAADADALEQGRRRRAPRRGRRAARYGLLVRLPVEPVLVILGIDAVLDMLRTSVNVLGNCLATVVIARWEGEYRIDDA